MPSNRKSHDHRERYSHARYGWHYVALPHKAQQPNLPVVITTAHSTSIAVSSYEEGAFEYLPNLLTLMDGGNIPAQSQRIQIAAASAETRIERTTDIIGNAPAMQEVFRGLARLAQATSPS